MLGQDKTFTIPCHFDINIYHFSITVLSQDKNFTIPRLASSTFHQRRPHHHWSGQRSDDCNCRDPFRSWTFSLLSPSTGKHHQALRWGWWQDKVHRLVVLSSYAELPYRQADRSLQGRKLQIPQSKWSKVYVQTFGYITIPRCQVRHARRHLLVPLTGVIWGWEHEFVELCHSPEVLSWH